MQEISERTYRSLAVIKRTLETYKVPLREVGSDYHNPIVLPEDGYKETYEAGDLVFSARYNTPARVTRLKGIDEHHGAVYGIYLLGTHRQNAYQPAYELGDLTYLEETLGIKLSK